MNNLSKRLIQLLIFLTFIYSSTLGARAAQTLSYSDCLLENSTWGAVSLGKPLATERLGTKTKVRIGVLPFYFTNTSPHELTNDEKNDYFTTATRINQLSNGLVQVSFVFFPSVNSKMSTSEFAKFMEDYKSFGWKLKDLSKSTWGFVKNLVTSNDPNLDYSNLDSIILEGNDASSISPISPDHVAEAMMFFRGSNSSFSDSGSEFFHSIVTKEGFIDNAVLLEKHYDTKVITHEILHNFGLTDLYGGDKSPIGSSEMAQGTGLSPRLLNYEKAVLGWFPQDKITCSNLSDFFDAAKVINKITISDISNDSIRILRTSSNSAYLIEVEHESNNSIILIYSLNNDGRPPIDLYRNSEESQFLTYPQPYKLLGANSIGVSFGTPDFDAFISDSTGNTISLNLIPHKLLDSEEAKTFIVKLSEIKLAAIADEKSKTDVRAKTAADKTAADASATAAKTKIQTITCSKGKLTKKVTGTNPKCPAGYKQK